MDESQRRRVSLAGFSIISVGIEVERVEQSEVAPVLCTGVKVMLRVGHDSTGLRVGPLHITGAAYRVGPSLSTEELREVAKEAIHNAIDHEISEWLRVDDVRKPVDHPPEPPT